MAGPDIIRTRLERDRGRCSFCTRCLHQEPATLFGPPGIDGRVKCLRACRSCWQKIRDRSGLHGQRHGATPPDGTPPGPRSRQAV
jgi:hypothetical protein